MQELNLPTYQFKYKEGGKRTQIFDPLRKKFVSLTPEEWVRQNFVQFLIRQHHYPASLTKIEAPLRLHHQQRYADVLIYTRETKPFLIIECKAPSVKISQNTFDQAARYNIVLQVPYIIVTNGMQHFCCHINHSNKSYEFIKGIPEFPKTT